MTRDSGTGSYGVVVASPGFRRWAIVATAARLALAMMPLGLVLAGAAGVGSLARGAVLAGAFTAGEVVAAPALARRVPLPLGLLGMGLSALAMSVAVALGSGTLPLVLVATILGVSGAGVPGQVRVWLTDLVPGAARPAAYSLETTASAALFVAGPAAVAVVATIGPWAGMAVAGLVLVSAAPLTRAVTSAHAADRAGPTPLRRIARQVWPGCVTAACFMGAVAAVDVAVPALLAGHGRPAASAGYLLAAFALSGILGGAAYGARAWPGSPAAHAALCTTITTGMLAALALAGSATAMLGVLLVAGLFGPPSLIARSVDLQAVLAVADLAVGFSLLSASAGVGASSVSFILGGLIGQMSVATALVLVLAALVAITLGVTLLDLSRRTEHAR